MSQQPTVLKATFVSPETGKGVTLELDEYAMVAVKGALSTGTREMKARATQLAQKGEPERAGRALVLAGATEGMETAILTVTGEKPAKGQKKKK